MGIDVELFKSIIGGLRDQYDYDKARAKKLSEIYGSDVMPSDNSRLTNTIFKILHKTFPPSDGFCAIQVFCYDLDFGRSKSLDWSEDPVSELWEQLVSDIDVEFEEVKNG